MNPFRYLVCAFRRWRERRRQARQRFHFRASQLLANGRRAPEVRREILQRAKTNPAKE